VFMPPRHGKSELCSIYAPVWWLKHWPDESVCVSSYAAELADGFGRKVRNIIDEHPAQLGIKLAKDSTSASRWHIEGKRGGMFTSGVGGPLTGRGFHFGVCDDPFKNFEEAHSEVMREKVWDWWRSTFWTRREPNACVLLVMTRWHHDDLAGRLLTHEPEAWDVINYTALAEDKDILGREANSPLWPERYNEQALGEIKRTIGSAMFEALYQQRPTVDEGAIIKREWFGYYQRLPEGKPSKLVWSYDTAFKTKAENDYTASQLWGKWGGDYYLLDLRKERLEFPELKRRALASYEGSPRPDALLIEDKASGQSLIQELRKNSRVPVIAVKVDSDKVSRCYAVTPLIEAGRVYLPAKHPLIDDFVQECTAFPLGAHDDQVDAMTQALNHLKGAEVWVV
jgi:predicted phage terminase large subunit-like protein